MYINSWENRCVRNVCTSMFWFGIDYRYKALMDPRPHADRKTTSQYEHSISQTTHCHGMSSDKQLCPKQIGQLI